MELWRKKNTATRIVFPIVDADGDTVTSAADLDSEYALFNTADHGGAAPSFSDCEHEATEIGTTGVYYLDVAAGEVNADFSYIQVKTSTAGAKTQHLLIRTMVADPLHIATTDDDNAIDASALNTLAGHDPGATLVKVADLPAAAPSAATVADAVLDEAAAGHAGFLTTLATAAALTTVDGIVDSILVATNKLDSTMEADGLVYRFTQNALEEGPTGGALPTAGEIADAVWEETLADHSGTAGSTAEQIANIAVGSPPSAEAVADAVLLRPTSAVEAGAAADTLCTAIMRSTNRTRRNVNVVETYRRDGVTLHAYQQVTPDPTGQPVSDISGAQAV